MARYTAQEMRTVADNMCSDFTFARIPSRDGRSYRDIRSLEVTEMLRQAADAMEREKKYEYAVRMDSGEVYGQFHDITEARDEAEFVNSDGLIICHAVRREVGEWEEVE